MKKKELTIKQYLETEEYIELRNNLRKEVNNNSVNFNLKISRDNNILPGTNLILNINKEKTHNKLLLKKIKSFWKSQSTESLDKGRNDILTQLTSIGIPNWNVKFKSI